MGHKTCGYPGRAGMLMGPGKIRCSSQEFLHLVGYWWDKNYCILVDGSKRAAITMGFPWSASHICRVPKAWWTTVIVIASTSKEDATDAG